MVYGLGMGSVSCTLGCATDPIPKTINNNYVVYFFVVIKTTKKNNLLFLFMKERRDVKFHWNNGTVTTFLYSTTYLGQYVLLSTYCT